MTNRLVMIKRITLISTLFLFITALCGFNSVAAQGGSQQLSIGYVDPQSILNKMPEMKAIQQRLQNFYERKQQELGEKEQEYNQQVQDYRDKAAVINEEAKKKEEERLGKLYANLQQFQSQIQQEIQQKQQELLAPLFQQINQAISNVAQERNLTYVINTTTSQGDMIILYASPEAQQRYNITDAVMRELGI